MEDYYFTSLRMQNFRSYKDFALELMPSVNIIVGPNASGKTNLLEALLVICGVSSYRVGTKDLIFNGENWARVDAIVEGNNRTIKINNKGEILEKIYTINEKPKKRLNFEEKLPVVLFEPEDMRLLTGSPDLRREFFDRYLENTKPEFSALKNKYKRVLAQRNHLLKSSPVAIERQIFAWNIRLGELAGKIVKFRAELIETLNKNISEIYSELAHCESSVNIKYNVQLPVESYESALLKALEQTLQTDILRGYTYWGPHRDDYELSINDNSASLVASRGETRTLVLSLKLQEIDVISRKRERRPLVLLDDVFSELDGSRRKALTNYLRNCQTVITTTDADVIQKNFAQHTNLVSLN